MPDLLAPITGFFQRRRREQRLQRAAGWPTVTAKLLKSEVVTKSPVAEGGTAFQESQVESGFYFTLEGGYFGGHLRSVPLSDSEAHRILRSLPEDLPIVVRYNPANPDQTATLAGDNPGFPVGLWSN